MEAKNKYTERARIKLIQFDSFPQALPNDDWGTQSDSPLRSYTHKVEWLRWYASIEHKQLSLWKFG